MTQVSPVKPLGNISLTTDGASGENPISRLVVAPNGYVYFASFHTQDIRIYRTSMDGAGGLVEQDPNNNGTPLTTAAAEGGIAIDKDGIIHCVQTNTSSGVLYYFTFDTNSNAWTLTNEQVDIGVSAGARPHISVDYNGVAHVVYRRSSGLQMMYANRIGGTWSAEAIGGTDTPLFVKCSDKSVAILSVLNNVGFLYVRSSIDAGGTFNSHSLERLDVAIRSWLPDTAMMDMVGVRGGWVLLIRDVHSQYDSVDVIFIGSRGSGIHLDFYHDVLKAGDAQFAASPEIDQAKLTVSEDGETVTVTALVQGTNNISEVLQKSRSTKSDGFDSGPAVSVYHESAIAQVCHISAAPLFSSDVRSAVFFINTDGTDTVVGIFSGPGRPPLAGVTHDIVLDQNGFMLSGIMAKSDITASIPRISIATDQKKQHDFSEMDTFGQNTFHQGRGERYLKNPEAFYDSDDVLTHIPNQCCLALSSYITSSSAAVTELHKDAASGFNYTGSGTFTWDHTIGSGSNRLLMVGVASRNGTGEITGITYGGEALTKLNESATSGAEAELWYLKEAEIATAASTAIVVTSSAAEPMVGLAVSYIDVEQTTTFGTEVTANGTNSAPSTTVTSASNEIVMDMVAALSDEISLGSGQSLAYRGSAGGSGSGAGTASITDTSSISGSGSSLNNVVTSSGSNRLILAAVVVPSSATISSIVTDEGAMTQVSGSEVNQHSKKLAWYYYVAPTVGSRTITVTTTGAGGIQLTLLALSGAAQSSTFGTAVTNSITINATSTALSTAGLSGGGLAVAASVVTMSNFLGASSGTGETTRELTTLSTQTQLTSSKIPPGSGTYQMQHQFVHFPSGGITAVMSSVPVNSATATASTQVYGFGSTATGATSKSMTWTIAAPAAWASIAVGIAPATPTPAGTDFNGAPVKFIVFAGNWYMLVAGTAAANNALYVWDNPNGVWDTVSAGLDTSSGTPLDMARYGEDLWVAQGEAVNMRTFDASAAAWEAGGVPARALANWDGKLFRADNINEIYYSTNPDNASPTWTLAATVSDSDAFINKMIVYQDALFVFKEDSVHALERDGEGAYILREIGSDGPFRNGDNGFAAYVDRGVLFWNRGDSVVRFDGSTVSQVGPDRGADVLGSNFIGLPADEVGRFRDLCGDGAFIYGAVNPSEDTAYPQVMVYNGVGWHSFWKGRTAGADIKAVAFLPARTSTGVMSYPTLWFGDGETVRYIKLPRNSFNPLDDTTLEYVDGSNAFLEAAWYDAQLPAVSKVFGEIEVIQDTPTVNGELSVAVDMQFNELEAESASWSYHNNTGTDGWFKLPSQTNDSRNIKFNVGDIHSGSLTEPIGLGGSAVAKKFRIRIRPTRGATLTATPVIRNYAYHFVVKPRPRYGWTLPLKVYKQITTLDDREEEMDSEAIRRMLYNLRESETPIFFDDGTSQGTRRNALNDPGFEVSLWDDYGTVDQSNHCSQHKKGGLLSQFVYVTTADSGVISPLVPVSAGLSLSATLSVLNSGPSFVSVQLLLAGEVVEVVAVGPDARWQDVVLTTTTNADVNAQIRVSSPGTAGFHIDNAMVVVGSEETEEYFDGDDPHSYWEGDPYRSPSVHHRGTTVYITGINEVFRFRKTEGEPTWDSEITVQLREVV